jgi:hypothetical protein
MIIDSHNIDQRLKIVLAAFLKDNTYKFFDADLT